MQKIHFNTITKFLLKIEWMPKIILWQLNSFNDQLPPQHPQLATLEWVKNNVWNKICLKYTVKTLGERFAWYWISHMLAIVRREGGGGNKGQQQPFDYCNSSYQLRCPQPLNLDTPKLNWFILCMRALHWYGIAYNETVICLQQLSNISMTEMRLCDKCIDIISL